MLKSRRTRARQGIARYNDVTIQNCYLDTVNRWGIAVGYTYEWAKFNGGALSDETMKTYASSDVVIQNNYLNNVGGDAITTMYIDRPVIQYNVSENAAAQINTTDYTDPQPQLDANGNQTERRIQEEESRQVSGRGNVKMRCSNIMNVLRR